MLTYITRRLLLLPVVLMGVTLLIFGFTQFISPYQRLFCYLPSNPSRITQSQIEPLLEKYHLTDPLPVQYFSWLKQVAHGNLGWSQTTHQSVWKTLISRFPATAELALYAIIPTVIFGLYLGIISALHRNDPIDHLTRALAIGGYGLPSFVLGLVFLAIFYGWLDWFPAGRLSTWASVVVQSTGFRSYTGLNTVDALLNGNLKVFFDAVRHLILPVITLAVLNWALTLRVMRSSMLETLREDYVATARAKGLKEREVILKHVARNALLPVVTLAVLNIVFLFNGVVVIETVFNYKGVGLWAANAALQLDVPAIIAVTLFAAILVLFGNLAVDLLYAALDPTVRYN